MKKVFEALEKIKEQFGCDPAYYGLELEFEILQQAINRLEAIDNAKPNEAMKCLEKLNYYAPIEKQDNEYYIIKRYILNAQENEKALELIKPHLRLMGNCLQARAPFVKKIEGDQESDSWVFVKEITDVEELEVLKRWLRNGKSI